MKIRLIWKQRKEIRERAESARQEVEESRRRYDSALQKVATLRTLHGQNHFAEIIAESIAEGYNRK